MSQGPIHAGVTVVSLDLAARLGAAQVAVEARLLPVLGPLLPLRVPEVLAVGQPGLGYPHPRSVLRWLPRADAFTTAITDDPTAARALAEFVGT
jgi:hypothetical protein